MLVARLNSDGAINWSRYASLTNGAPASAASDTAGNAFILGDFRGYFGIGGSNLISTGDSDLFTVKYDSGGTVSWARQAGHVFRDLSSSIACDASGNAVVAGIFHDTIRFDSILVS